MSYQKLAQALNDSVNMYTPDVLYPRECLIIDVNEDETLKIKVNIGENIYLDEVRYIGIPKTNSIGLFIPLNNNYDEGYCICYNETTESLTENVIINNINSSETEKVNDVNESEEETSEEITNEVSEETQANINYDRRYAKINHTHTENVGTIEDLKTLIKNTKEGNILSLDKNFKNERYGNIIINKKITIDGNGHSIENISFTCDANEIELNNIVFFNVTTNRVNGGALQLNGQRISINNCIFYNNIINGTSVYEGGAISVNSSSIETKITDCYFISNFCSNNGGAVRWIGNDGVLIGCKFIGNTATNSGGAIKWLGINGLVRDCLFEDNKSNNAKDIFTTDENLLGIGNKFLTESDIIGSERFYDYITEYDKKEIEDEIHSSFGRNILYDTQEMIVGTPPNNISYIGEFRNNKVICFDDESSNENGYRDWYYDIPIDEFNYNDEFTLSFWVRSNKENIGKIKAYFTGDIKNKVINSNGYDYSDTFNDGHIVFDVNDEWKKCFVTWKLNSTGDSTIQKRVIIRIFDGAEIYLTSPKLERGKVSTDWTPNPNDKLDGAIPINASSVNNDIDLNNYVNTGLYYQSNNSNSQYVQNKPTDDNLAFSLFVEKQTNNGVKQTLTYYDYPKTSRMFVRIKHYDTNNWTRWERIQFTGMNEGGANLLNIGSYYQSGGNEVQGGIMHNGHNSVYINNLDKTSSQHTDISWLLPNGFHNYDEIYTLSFWAKCSDDNSVDKYITTYFGGESGYVTVKRIDSNSTVNTTQGSFNDGRTDFKLSKEWQHFYVVYQLNGSGNLTPRKQSIIRVWGESEAYISSPKLEKGYNVSDWTPSVLNAELIYPNMDLNDFTMKGEYRCPLTPWVKKISNVPIDLEVAFNLKVEPTTDNGCVQTFSAYLPYKTMIYKRSMYNNDWSSWNTSVTEPRIISVCDINSGDSNALGYAKSFKIFIDDFYINTPISFEINRRGNYRPIKCYLRFNNQNDKNPTIDYFTYDGEEVDIYICNEEYRYYTIYIKKFEQNDYIEVKNFNFNERYTVNQKMRIIPLNDQIPKADLPYQLSTNYNSGQNDKKAVNVVKIESNNDITLSNNLTVNGDFSSGNIINKLSTSSTDEEIPTAKAVYDEFKVIDWLNEYSWETYYDNGIKPIIDDDKIIMNKGNFCYLKYEFTHNKYYEMEFDFICTDNRGTDLIIGGNKTSNNWYEILYELDDIKIYERKNDTYTLITSFSNTFFRFGDNKIKMIRNNNYLNFYVNDKLMYEFEFKDYHNIIGIGKDYGLDDSYVYIKNIKIYNTSKTYTYKKVETDEKCKNRWKFWGVYQGMQSLTNTNVVLSNTDELYFGGYKYTYYGEEYDEPIELTFKLNNNVSVYVSKNQDDLYNLYDEDKLTYNVIKNFTLDVNESVYILVRDKNGTAMNTYTANINYEVKDIVMGTVNNIVDIIYPIGSIYMSVNNVNPNILFGGQWEQLKDRFLLGSGDTYTGGATGGSADAVVVKHNHTQNPHNHTQNAHSHSPGSGRSFMTAPTGSAWNEIVGSNISGSGYHYVVTQDKKNYNVYVAGSGNATATNQQQTATNKESGEDGTGKNMPPYLTVYMWKRIG